MLIYYNRSVGAQKLMEVYKPILLYGLRIRVVNNIVLCTARYAPKL